MTNWLQYAGSTLTGLLALCLALMPPFPAHARDGQTSFAANDVEFLNLMGNLEGPRGFGTISDFAPALPDRPLTEMTLAEVLDYQREIRALGTISSAVGRYQFIYLTLRDLVETHGISDSLVFDGEVQTYLARFLMHQCGFFDHATPNVQLANCLAGVWAALPLVSGPERGQSAYAADGVNKAFTTPETVLDVLGRRFEW
ncbi:hypothetical protein [Roseinatronobacter monicus]|uniref:Muramidase (Phage lysozyme) n=1 Tax=Roseinatronobacter monicus TaxID=393481 RepID=A0A543K4G9_9RHOB|nr:hypothetical protein [Roseinatronobacter monicus]TQM89979.1 hypothetical protein BD293_4298 [Roseinatronobacter monicus]